MPQRKNKIAFEELVLEMMPFSKQILDWCKKHSEFQKALKVIYSNRFIALGAIVTSYSPNYPEDEVIGIYTYDYKIENPKFKQDFIVNKGKQDKEFVLYTRNPGGQSSRYVKDINDFYKTYGKGGFYLNSHHLTLEQLPKEIRERGKRAIALAEKIQKLGGFVKPTQDHIDKIHNAVMNEKAGKWFTREKLNK